MQTVQLGRSGLYVSPLAFGCMSTVANATYPGADEQDAVSAIHAAIDLGINLFDTAPSYGDGASERLLGRALRGRRDRVLIADKILTPRLTPQDVQEQCELSLARLGTDRIDLYQIHWPATASDRASINETLGAMHSLVEAGKVRALGVCNFGPRDLTEAVAAGIPLASNQIPYSLLARGIEHELCGLCQEHGLSLLCYSPLAQGLLTGRYDTADGVPVSRARTRLFAGSRPQAVHGEAGCEREVFEAITGLRRISERLGRPMADVALAWLLHQPNVAGAIVGASRADQVKRNITAADLSLSPADLDELDHLTRPVKTALGTNLDPWQSSPRIH